MKVNKIFLLVLVAILSCRLIAGTSIFGYGSKLPGSYQYPYTTVAAGRGGVEMAIVDSMSLNQTNFALWAVLSRTTISLNLRFQGISTKSNYQDMSSFDASVRGGFFAIPLLKKKLVIGMGLIPQFKNDIGVKIMDIGFGASAVQTVETSGNIGDAKFILSYAPFSNFSLAVVPSYTFGFIADDIAIRYDDNAYGNIFIQNKFKIYGPGVGFYAFYQLGSKFAIGGKAIIPTKLTLYTEQMSLSKKETVVEFRKVMLPQNIGIGIAYKISNRWQAGLDLDYSNWKDDYKIEDVTIGDVTNSYRIGAGFERLPEPRRFISTVADITYRAGLFYGQLYKIANTNYVSEYGISFGIGVPIIRQNSHLDFAFEYGQRGNLSKNLLKESFFRLYISVSANELWFQREER